MSQITSHILDVSKGKPACDVSITLSYWVNDAWQEIANGCTNEDGRVSDLCRADEALKAGTYQMHFATADYFNKMGEPVFYPWADVVFNVEAGGAHYHIPLLLSAFGYSTYRGS